MGRKRKNTVLEIYVGRTKIGIYAQSASGSTSFYYDPDWLSNKTAFPISLSMPLSDRIWSGTQCLSFFEGLLPDDQNIRKKIAKLAVQCSVPTKTFGPILEGIKKRAKTWVAS